MTRSVGELVRRTVTLTAVATGAAAIAFGSSAVVHAQDSTVPPGSTSPLVSTPPEGTVQTATAPLVVVPNGCVTPTPPDFVFVGTLVDRDYRTGRFRIDQVRAGDASGFSMQGLVDVRYGNDVQYLELDHEYLVGAGVDPDLGVLVSQIRAPAPPFGGDDVVGVTDSDEPCPVLEDPVRTLQPDGRSVESGVLAPFFDERDQLAGAFLVPLGVACAVIVALAFVRLLLDALARGVGSVARHRR